MKTSQFQNAINDSKISLFSSSYYLNKVRKPKAIGPKHGLTVLLNSSISDYFFSDRSTTGFVVQLFKSMQFPDKTTGGVSEILVSPEEDVSLHVNVEMVQSESRIRSYSVKKRQCYFEDENFELYGDNYSLSECLTKCKLRSIEALCNCIPFYTPANFIEKNKTTVVCSLANIACLERYRGEIFIYVINKLDFFIFSFQSHLEHIPTPRRCQRAGERDGGRIELSGLHTSLFRCHVQLRLVVLDDISL